MSTTLPKAEQLLQEYFSIDSLNELLSSKIKRSKARGIDRISFDQFVKQSAQEIEIIYKKCLETIKTQYHIIIDPCSENHEKEIFYGFKQRMAKTWKTKILTLWKLF